MDANWCADRASGVIFCKIHTGLNFPDVLEKVEAIEDSFVFLVIIVVHPLTPSTNATTAV